MVIQSIEINRLFVTIFKLLAKYEEKTTKFDQLAIVFGTLVLNEKLLLKFCAEYDRHSSDIENIIYFKNTDFSDIYSNKCSNNERNTIVSSLKKIYDLSQTELLSKNVENHTDPNNDMDRTIDMILKTPALQKMIGMNSKNINAKKLKKMFKTDPRLKKLIENISNSGIHNGTATEEDMKNLMLNIFKDNDLVNSFYNFADNNIFKALIANIQNQEGNDIFKTIYEKIKNDHPDILEEIENIVQMFDADKMMILFEEIRKKFEKVDLSDMSKIIDFLKSFVSEDQSIQGLIWKFHMTIESGLVNIENIKSLLRKIMKISLREFSTNDLIKKSEYSTLINLIYGKKTKRRPKNSKKERKHNRIKSYRRKKKKELRKKYRHKKNKNKTKEQNKTNS